MTSVLKNFSLAEGSAGLERQALDQLCVNALRFLSVDMVEQAKSGHPGLPLDAAPMMYVLWTRFMRHNPRNPGWPDRDRFILSAGHGSALLYAMLHLAGYDLPLEEIKRFRQWGSMTPGHPEYGHAPGVEATTGPLGQGFAMGVGMAMAEAHLAARFNRPDEAILDHYTYGIVSDGDLMEGIASEAASFAGTMGLGKLIYLYDNNHVSLEAPTDITFREDVERRFQAYGWHTVTVPDGNDLETIEAAIRLGRAETQRPSLILVRTHLGYGSPRQDTPAAHGEPLGPEFTKQTKLKLGWPTEPRFYIPDEVQAHFRQAVARGAEQETEWKQKLESYRGQHPAEAAELERRLLRRELPADWDAGLPAFPADKPLATREASGLALNALAPRLPELVGGSADLNPSTKTALSGQGDFDCGECGGRNLHFGVREHAMGAIVNGMALHQGVIPYGATFLIFSDYMKPALRLACLMNVHSVFVYTHDSIGLGEDGPTHQPIEQLAQLRAIPRMAVLRPADANETAAAWRIAIARKGPVCLALTRQKLPVLDAQRYPTRTGTARGAYVLAEAEGKTDIVLIATGSEVHLALAAQQQLAKDKQVKARVVSMPSWELFDEQPPEYRSQVLPAGMPKLAIEAGSPLGWRQYVGERGDVIALDRFGASAPGEIVMEKLGFSVENVVSRALALLGSRG